MSRTILIVDDSKMERIILNAYLKADYDIIETADGEEALKVLRTRWQSISAIVMDIVMPKLDGFETLKAIKANEQWFQIPVVITTSLDDYDSREKAVALGADSFVTKPFDQDQLLHVLNNAVALSEISVTVDQIIRDRLTGLLSRDSFFAEAERIIHRYEPGHFTLACVNIENFKVINDQYGSETGDEVLQHIASNLKGFVSGIKGLCGRYMADIFTVLYPTETRDSQQIEEYHQEITNPKCIRQPIRIRIGRYTVKDMDLPVSAMFDRASIAQIMVKGRYDTYIGDYHEKMRDDLLREQQIVEDMVGALENGEFEPWFQPQYNHSTGALIGAEALVRWRREGKIVTPNEFIPVFEKNGFIYEVDKFVWRLSCSLLRRWLDEGKEPPPISVNISRYDIYQPDFFQTICGLIEEYNIPIDLLHLEITESSFFGGAGVIIGVVGRLIEHGFTVEIDDFGSGYSSLSTLKDVPASILKLDMRFFETTKNSERGGNIIESIVRMAKWLGMAVIAEGVEEKAQADYLKTIGCYYIQGYYYARPMPVEDYEIQMEKKAKEAKLSRLETLETLDSNLFWDPKSMETLIFNSYAGGACIFEAHDNSTELLRVNDQYVGEMHGLVPDGAQLKDSSIIAFIDEKGQETIKNTLLSARNTGRAASCEVRLSDGKQVEYIRYTVRMIAQTTERRLYYAVIVNITEQREAEQKREEAAKQLQIIMGNVNGSVSAFTMDEAGNTTPIFYNEKYYEIYGYTKEQAEEIQLDVMACILPDDFTDVLDKLNRLKKDGVPIDIDFRAKKRDGSIIFVRSIASRMHIDGYGGEVIVAVNTDFTEQHTLQDQLRAIIDNINGGVSVVHMRGDMPEFLLVNEAYFEIIGYTREQFFAELNNAFAFVHPDDRERVMKLFKDSEAEQKRYTMEYRIVRRNGATRHILCNTTVMYLFGLEEPVQLSVLNDITILREAQQKERDISIQIHTILQSIHGGVSASVFHDENHIEIAFANDGFYKLFGYTPEQFHAEVPSAIDPILPEDRKKTITTVSRILRERGSGTYEYRCRKRDGSVVWIQTTNAVVSLAGVGDTVLLAVTTDVTALRRTEKERLEIADRLNVVMNAMTNGMTAVAHQGNIQFLFANDNYYRIHGIDKNSSGADTLSRAFSMIHSEDRKSIKDIIKSLTDVGQIAEAKYRINLPDGTIRHVKAEITVINLIGVEAPVQVAIYTDTTDENRASEQLRFLNESAREILALGDGEKAIEEALRRMLLYFGGERLSVFELDDITQSSHRTHQLYAPGVTPQPEHQSIPYSTQMSWFEEFRKKGFVTIYDVASINENESALRELLLVQNIHSIIVAPLWRDKELIGYIRVDNPTKAVEHMSQLIALSDYIAIILNHRNLIGSAKHGQKALKQLMEDTPGGFLCARIFPDGNSTIINFNSGFCRILGMSAQEVMEEYKDNAYNYITPEDISSFKDSFAEALAETRSYTCKFRIKKKEGALLWVRMFGRFIQGEKGECFLNSYFTDISEQRKTEQLEIELLDKMPIGAALLEYNRETLSVIHINKHYWAIVGREAKEYGDLSPLGAIHPDERAFITREIESAIRSHRNPAGDCRLLYGDEGYRVFHISAKIEEKEGGVYLLYAICSPISEGIMPFNTFEATEQGNADTIRIQLLDNLPFGAALFNFDGENLSTIHFNKQYRRIVNGEWIGDASHLDPASYIHPADQQMVFQEIKEAIAQGRNGKCEVRLRFGGDEYRNFRLDANIVANDDGTHLLFVAYTPLTQQELNFKSMLPLMFEKIMEFSTDLAFAKDLNFRYICCSKTFAELVGLEREEDVVGKDDYELFPKEIADKFRRDDSALFATQKPLVDIQEMLPSTDGTPHYIRTTKHLLRSVTGEAIGIYCTGREITEIREAYAQLKLLTDSIPGGIATFRCMPNNIETLYYNDGICALFGYSSEEFEALRISLPDLVFSEDQSIIKQQMEQLKSGETYLNFIVRIHAKERMKWISIVAHATDHIGEIYNVSAVVTDVTAQQEERENLRLANEEYRIATLHANRTICRYDIATQTISMSPEAAKRLNLPELIYSVPYGRVGEGSISEDTKEAYIDFFESIMGGEKECSTIFCELLSTGKRWVKINATTVMNTEGKPFSAIISYIDITEQREKEAIYNRWQNSISERPKESYTLFRCNLSKRFFYESWDGDLLHISFDEGKNTFEERTEEFIAQCVHESDRERYRTFLHIDRMMAEYYNGRRTDSIEFRESLPNGKIRWLKLTVDMVEYSDSPEVQAYLMYENIDEQKRNQQRILEQAETDPLTGVLNRTTFAARANHIIGESKSGIKHALLMLDIDNFKLVNDIFGHGAGDRTLCEITDLMSRSLRRDDLLGRLGGDEFVVFLTNIPNEMVAGGKAQLFCELIRKDLGMDVKVSGSIGIAMFPQDGESFEDLYKAADNALYHAKNRGKNTYAFIHGNLPMEMSLPQQPQKPKTTFKDKSILRRILIVDDNNTDLDILFEMFKKDFRVEKAMNGAMALAKLQHYGTAISVVLLDLNMPDMDGYEVLRRMKEEEATQTIPVIVVSADEQQETTLKVIHAGADDLIVKPVNPEILRIRVQAAINRSENERMRAQSSFLSLRHTETNSYKSALERSGIMVISLEWGKNEFIYSPSVSARLPGEYDGKKFWSALLSNMVTDSQSVQKMQQLVHEVAENRERMEGTMKVKLKTASGAARMFEMHAFKEVNDFGIALRIIITLKELTSVHRSR